MTSKIYFAIALLCVFLSENSCFAQKENTKDFLFLSVFCEESDSYYEQSADIVKKFPVLYKEFTYKCSRPLEIPVDMLSGDSLMDYEKYTIQLFKITRDSVIPTYYILKINPCDTYRFSFPETLWIRISGYRESDIKVFFDALRKRGLKKKDIIEMVELWRSSDEMFSEIDWDCIMKGYFKNNTHSNCFFSGSNMLYSARFFDEKDNVYADFSKRPLSGTLFKFD